MLDRDRFRILAWLSLLIVIGGVAVIALNTPGNAERNAISVGLRQLEAAESGYSASYISNAMRRSTEALATAKYLRQTRENMNLVASTVATLAGLITLTIWTYLWVKPIPSEKPKVHDILTLTPVVINSAKTTARDAICKLASIPSEITRWRFSKPQSIPTHCVCSLCGNHFHYDPSASGKDDNCPHCKSVVTLP